MISRQELLEVVWLLTCSLCKHLLRYGGIYIVLGIFYAHVFWILPLKLGGWSAVGMSHLGALVAVWAVCGITGIANKKH